MEIDASNARRGVFVSMIPIVDTWDRFRYALRCAGLDASSIEREVRRIDGLATGALGPDVEPAAVVATSDPSQLARRINRALRLAAESKRARPSSEVL